MAYEVSSLRAESFVLPEQNVSVKQADLRVIFKKASKIFCPSNIVESPDILSLTLWTSSAINTPENIEENTKDPEPPHAGDIQMEYLSD